jgi:O-antigen/teichoic acid export membrane protein
MRLNVHILNFWKALRRRGDRRAAIQSQTDHIEPCAEPADTRSHGQELTAALRVLKLGASGAFVVQIAGAGIGLAAHFAIARLIGKSEYGIFALALSWVSTLAVIAQLGQDVSVVRFLPGYCLRGDWGKARGLRRGVGALVLCASILIAIVGFVVIYGASANHEPAWSRTLYIAFSMLPVLTQLQQSSALHRAFKRAISSGIYTAVVRPVILIALLAALVFAGVKVNAVAAMTASVLSAVAALAISAWDLSRAWPAQHRNVDPKYELRRWATAGVHLSVLSIVVVAGNRIDVLLLGALAGTSEVGAYYAAAQIAGFALYGLQAANVVLAPMIAERYDEGDFKGLQLIARRAARLGFMGALAISIFFVCTGHWVLGLFGKGFASAFVPLLILLLGYCAVAAMGEVGFMLSMTRYQKQATFFALIGIVVNGLTSWMLVPSLGAVGAAIGAAFSMLAWRYLALRFVIKNLGVNPAIIGGVIAIGTE